MSPDPDDASLEICLDATPEHAGVAIAVMHGAFAEYAASGEPSGAMRETPESLREEMKNGTGVAIALMGGTAVATVKYRTANDGTLGFGRLAILPSARGRGLASALVQALRQAAHSRGLRGLSCSVRAAEPRNIAIYEHLGMAVVGHGEHRSLTGAVIPVVHMRDVPVELDPGPRGVCQTSDDRPGCRNCRAHRLG